MRYLDLHCLICKYLGISQISFLNISRIQPLCTLFATTSLMQVTLIFLGPSISCFYSWPLQFILHIGPNDPFTTEVRPCHSSVQPPSGFPALQAQHKGLRGPSQSSTPFPAPTTSHYNGLLAVPGTHLAMSSSGPLHLLFLWLEMLFQVITCLILSLYSVLCSHVTLQSGLF